MGWQLALYSRQTRATRQLKLFVYGVFHSPQKIGLGVSGTGLFNAANQAATTRTCGFSFGLSVFKSDRHKSTCRLSCKLLSRLGSVKSYARLKSKRAFPPILLFGNEGPQKKFFLGTREGVIKVISGKAVNFFATPCADHALSTWIREVGFVERRYVNRFLTFVVETKFSDR